MPIIFIILVLLFSALFVWLMHYNLRVYDAKTRKNCLVLAILTVIILESCLTLLVSKSFDIIFNENIGYISKLLCFLVVLLVFTIVYLYIFLRKLWNIKNPRSAKIRFEKKKSTERGVRSYISISHIDELPIKESSKGFLLSPNKISITAGTNRIMVQRIDYLTRQCKPLVLFEKEFEMNFNRDSIYYIKSDDSKKTFEIKEI
jgi:hypothetical protein